jgi:hypothetical protein
VQSLTYSRRNSDALPVILPPSELFKAFDGFDTRKERGGRFILLPKAEKKGVTNQRKS